MKILTPSRRLVVGLMIALLAFFTAASESFAAENPKKLRLAYAGWEVGTAVAYVGIDSGIFKKHNLDVEEVFIRDTLSAGVQSLVGVDLLIGFGNPLAILQPVLRGADIALFGSHVSLEHYEMGVTPEIATLKELKGKKIGVSRLGGKSDLVARVMLRRAGLNPAKDVEMVAAGLSPARVVAISKNLVQGAPLSPEIAAEAKKLGIKVIDVKAVPVVTDLLLTTRSFIKKEQDVMRRFMKGYSAAIHFFLTRREDSLTILRKYVTGGQGGSLETMYNAFMAQLRPLPDLNIEAIQAFVDVAAVLDQRSSTLKPADLIDPRFVDELKDSSFLKDLYTEKVRL